MDADTAVNLVMQADLFVGLVFSTGKLNAIHAQVGSLQAGLVGVLGVDLRQRDKCSAVVWPGL